MSSGDPWLMLDTSGPVACVGICAEGRVLGETALHESRRHAEELPGAIERALADAMLGFTDLRGVGVGQGPGSFVGVRVAIAKAKGICIARSIPLRGISGLLAMAAAAGLPDGDGWAWLDARRNEYYAQPVRRHGDRVMALDAPKTLSPAALRAAVANAGFGIGNGLPALFEGTVPDSVQAAGGPTVQGLWAAMLADEASAGESATSLDAASSLVPVYCRPPDAKLPSRALPADLRS